MDNPITPKDIQAQHVKADRASHLPTDAAERKALPIFSGVLRYFPDALAEVARVSKAGNDQHHPGTPLHWDKSKSTDEGDALIRHQLEAGTIDTDGQRHSAKVAWRALAQLQRELDADAEPDVTVGRGDPAMLRITPLPQETEASYTRSGPWALAGAPRLPVTQVDKVFPQDKALGVRAVPAPEDKLPIPGAPVPTRVELVEVLHRLGISQPLATADALLAQAEKR